MLTSALLLALGTAAAAQNCVHFNVPLTLTSRNGVFNVTTPQTEIDVTNFLLDFTRAGHNYTNSVITGYTTIRKDYTVAASYCEPERGGRDVLQILTHGIGFDRSYWDFAYDNRRYSYVSRAIEQGYSTLSWDRLGIAQSSHGDPIGEIQVFLEIAALRGLTQWVKDGKLFDGKHKNSKMVHVGHSFGSIITHGMTNETPELSNGIVLTGFTQVGTYLAQFLLGANFVSAKSVPALAEQYSEGYLATRSTIGLHTNFFAPRNFDPQVLQIAESTGQPAAIGELLTLGSMPAKSRFNGPVLIVTGERDVPFCGGDCMQTGPIMSSAPDLLQYSRRNFCAASVFETSVTPGAGHGLNYQFSAPLTYKAIIDFLNSHVHA